MPKLIYAKTEHKRFGNSPHRFSYSLPYLLVRIDDIAKTKDLSCLFSHNRFNLYSFYDTDYLSESSLSLSEKFLQISSRLTHPINTIYLLTFPRFLNKVFNPVSFYFNVNSENVILDVVAEVTNTYYDKHLYYLEKASSGHYFRNSQIKTFHVSPFLCEAGTYEFSIGSSLSKLEIHIVYKQKGRTLFYANLLEKKRLKMTTQALLKTTALYPGSSIRTVPRILFQAFVLSVFKKIKARKRPLPMHADTIRKRPPSFFENKCMKLVFKIFGTFTQDTLVVVLPDSTKTTFGMGKGEVVTLEVHDYEFFKRIVLKGEIGFGEAFVDGLWSSPNLTRLLVVFVKNMSKTNEKGKGHSIFELVESIRHLVRKNDLEGSKKNIFHHYDIGNEFYSLFLDSGMNYSSALFYSQSDSLEEAQIQKLDRLFSNLHVESHHHVLEIGSGWGSAAIRLAEKTGCKVTTLTVSESQYRVVKERIQAHKLENLITVVLQDYRLIEGQYDRIFSIEMIEAVGHEYLPGYFKKIETLLKPNGLVAIQAIVVPDQRYESYRKSSDWIKKYIFPGGHMPSLHKIQDILLKETTFILQDVKSMGFSYAKTLSCWRDRFLLRIEDVRKQGFDDAFIRKWIYYLSYCEAGFASHYIQAVQIVLTHPINGTLISKEIKKDL